MRAITAGLVMASGLLVVDAYILRFPLSWRIVATGMNDPARVVIFSEALSIIRANPWFGIGDTAVGKRIITLPELDSLPRTQQNAHDQYLHWAAAEGIPVAVGFCLLVVWAVYWCWRHAPTWSSPVNRALGWATAIGLAIFLVANLADAHFWRIEGGGFFWSLLAVTAAISRTEWRFANGTFARL